MAVGNHTDRRGLSDAAAIASRTLSGQPLVHLGLVTAIPLMASPLLLAFVMGSQTIPELEYIMNSLVMSVGIVAVSLLGALALVYYDFRFEDAVFFLILFTLMFPVPVRTVPLYELTVAWGRSNTLLALTWPYLASATAVLLLRQQFNPVPESLVEAARVDYTLDREPTYRIGGLDTLLEPVRGDADTDRLVTDGQHADDTTQQRQHQNFQR